MMSIPSLTSRRQGASLEEIDRDRRDSEAEYKRAKKFYKDLNKLVSVRRGCLTMKEMLTGINRLRKPVWKNDATNGACSACT